MMKLLSDENEEKFARSFVMFKSASNDFANDLLEFTIVKNLVQAINN
jgi:hypothetical protein